jgi:hypothetical protein
MRNFYYIFAAKIRHKHYNEVIKSRILFHDNGFLSNMLYANLIKMNEK